LYGYDGDDYINGGEGDDRAFGGAGDDKLYGKGGDDDLIGGRGDDKVDGGEGDDFILGFEGQNDLYGGDGDDRIIGGANEDDIWAGAGDDLVYGGFGADVIRGGAGDDLIKGNNSIYGDAPMQTEYEYIYGNEGEDAIFGQKGVEKQYLLGGAGNDYVTTPGYGIDVNVFGNDGDDFLRQGDKSSGLVTVKGGKGDDTINELVWNGTTDSVGVDRQYYVDITA